MAIHEYECNSCHFRTDILSWHEKICHNCGSSDLRQLIGSFKFKIIQGYYDPQLGRFIGDVSELKKVRKELGCHEGSPREVEDNMDRSISQYERESKQKLQEITNNVGAAMNSEKYTISDKN